MYAQCTTSVQLIIAIYQHTAQRVWFIASYIVWTNHEVVANIHS